MEIKHFKQTLSKIKKKNIAIMGHMGSGKSIFGKKLANYFDIEHIDVDKEISKHENSVRNSRYFLKCKFLHARATEFRDCQFEPPLE